MNELILVFDHDGTVSFIHDDALQPLMAEGVCQVTRGSHVEPQNASWGDSSPLWNADMGPVGGPVFEGFPTRSAALAYEREYIHREVFGVHG